MSIDVGDAVFTFLADTSQLDRAYAQVNAGTEAAVKPASLALEDMASKLDQTAIEASIATEQYTAAGRAALRMGEEGAAAGDEMSFSMHEAKGELALLGEQTGIHVPRHIRAFVAELPGVGKALNAAFEATAVLFLVQILGEAAQKLTEFIADKIIYTEEMKAEYKAQVDLNKQIDEQVRKLEGLKEIYKTLGMDAVQKSRYSINELADAMAENNKKFQEAKDIVFLYNNYLKGTKEEADKAANSITLLQKTLDAQEQQLMNLMKLHAEQLQAESIKRNEALIVAEKAKNDALNALQLQQNRVALLQRSASFSEQLAAQQTFEANGLQIEMNAAQERLAQLKRDPTKNVNAIIELQAHIEVLEKNHHTNMLKLYGDFLDKLKLEAKKLPDTIIQSSSEIENKAGEMLETVNQAFATLGITGVVPLTALLKSQQDAYTSLRASGMASSLDIMRADIALLQTKILLHKEQGDNTKKEEKDLQNLIDKYNDLTGAVGKVHIKQFDLFKMWKAEIPSASAAWKNLAQLGKQGLDEFARAAESAFASAILSESSFGDALRKGTAQVLAEIAARSLVYAVFYTAMGFARLAEWDFAGATAAFTAAGIYGGVGAVAAVGAYLINPKSSNNSTAVTGNSVSSVTDGGTVAAPAQTLVAVRNVQKFAAGGLVNGPTIAMMGEKIGGSREAAIPLDDPSAIQPIVDALGGGRGTTIHVHVEGLISPDNLGKVMNQINQRVKKGQGHLLASNALRITKRSV